MSLSRKVARTICRTNKFEYADTSNRLWKMVDARRNGETCMVKLRLPNAAVIGYGSTFANAFLDAERNANDFRG